MKPSNSGPQNFVKKNKSRLQNLQLLLMVALPILLYFAANANYTIMIIGLLVLMALVMLAAVIVN